MHYLIQIYANKKRVHAPSGVFLKIHHLFSRHNVNQNLKAYIYLSIEWLDANLVPRWFLLVLVLFVLRITGCINSLCQLVTFSLTNCVVVGFFLPEKQSKKRFDLKSHIGCLEAKKYLVFYDENTEYLCLVGSFLLELTWTCHYFSKRVLSWLKNTICEWKMS